MDTVTEAKMAIAITQAGGIESQKFEYKKTIKKLFLLKENYCRCSRRD